jgi:predicted amidohydrolase
MRSVVLLACPALLFSGQMNLLEESSFQESAVSWKKWSARSELAPKMYVDSLHSRGGPGSLAISAGGIAGASGRWEKLVSGVKPGSWYRLTAWYRAEGLQEEANEVLCRLAWAKSESESVGQPEYGWETSTEGSWRRISVAAPAPENASSAVVQLWLHNAKRGTVWWDDIRLEPIQEPPARSVKVAAVRFRPSRSTGPEENIRLFREVIEKQAPERADVILLPEGMTVVGTGRKYAEVAEPVPGGPTTKALGEIAKAKKSWVVAGLYERDGTLIYNTAVLIDRDGRFAGKYRKVYLPREEIEAGLTPGNEYPVFHTDFGRVGLMICWDVQFADPARALALNGAEVILLPIWGGNMTLTRARAIENSVFLATSGYDVPSLIIDPKGETLATSEVNGTVAFATLNLNHRYTWEWLGEMRGRFMREVRLDVPVQRPGPADQGRAAAR